MHPIALAGCGLDADRRSGPARSATTPTPTATATVIRCRPTAVGGTPVPAPRTRCESIAGDNREGYIFVPVPGEDLVIEYTDDDGDVVRVVVSD